MLTPDKMIPDAAIDSLKAQLRSARIYTPATEGYQDTLRRWSDTGSKPAGLVVMPTDPEDVRTALLWAQEHHVDLAVKGGGHSVAGTSSSAGGLVIDLSRMNTVSVDTAAKTVTAGGGATWRDVDEAAAQHGLATVGGTVNHTGVGGLTLGGGYGWLSSMYGLTIDNLLAAQVVLPSGAIVTASPTQHADLFWGLRGAGYNFGVVVSFIYQAYDQPHPVYAGILTFPPDQIEAVITQLNDRLTVANPDPRAGAICSLSQPPGAPSPMPHVLVFYNGTQAEGEAHFAGLLALGPLVNTAGMIPYPQLNSLQNLVTTYGDRKSFKGVFFHTPLDPAFARTMLADFTRKLAADPDVAASAIVLEFFKLRRVCAVPREATAFAGRSTTQNGVIIMRWTDASQDGKHRAWAREVQARWKSEMDGSAKVPEAVPQYINYAEPGDLVVDNIYGENLGRLQALKAKYDPTNVFHKMHPIPLPGDMNPARSL